MLGYVGLGVRNFDSGQNFDIHISVHIYEPWISTPRSIKKYDQNEVTSSIEFSYNKEVKFYYEKIHILQKIV